MDAAVRAALERGRRAWPELVVDEAMFATVIASSVGGVADAVDELAIEDLYLAQACATAAPAALAAFSASCDAALAGGLRQLGLADDVVEEVLHETRTKLFVAIAGHPKIATYSGHAALKTWTRTVATRVAIDRIRAREDMTSDDHILDKLPDAADTPDLAHLRATYQAELKGAFEEALATLDVRERNVLRLHFIDRLTIDEIGALYAVHKTTAFRWLEAARTALAKRTRSGFQQRVKVLPAELDSIVRLVQSHVDLSLSRVLA